MPISHIQDGHEYAEFMKKGIAHTRFHYLIDP